MSGEARVAGHFGEWLQGVLGPEGPVALVTLPCAALAVAARADPSGGTLSIRGRDARLVSVGQARRLLEALDLPTDVAVVLTADMPAGGGAGASTAALVALARAAGAGAVRPARMATACVEAEGATDPLMLRRPDRHLWASRGGRSLARLPALPPFEIVGGFWGPPVRTDPSDHRLPDVTDLVERWREAAARADRPALARIASRSAALTTAMRGPADDPTAALAASCGALGHLRAHTGSARGLVYAPGTAPPGIEKRLRSAGFVQVLRFRTGGSR